MPPEAVRWVDPTRAAQASGSLFDAPADPTPPPPPAGARPRVPRAFLARIETVACHADPTTWDLLYRLLHRLGPRAGADAASLDDPLDPDVAELERREAAVRRDAHKMHAFVRFRRVESPGDPGGERYVAWHRPLHRIVAREAGFFRDRFPSQAWSILTPHASAHWDTRALTLGPGAPADAAPREDELEALWVRYYASIFDPARARPAAMRAEMPVHHWPTLPETRAIPALLADVPARLEAMAASSQAVADSAAPFVPPERSLDALRAAAPACRGCELHRDGTRVVFGEGPPDARLALLGEQPGDREERAGRPFVGPAGELLDALLADAGLDRGALYLTNAVKHFHHAPDPTTRTRLHRTPRQGMVSRCLPWLDAEIALLEPEVLVCLGRTAARAAFGPTFRLHDAHGRPRPSRFAPTTLATFHPASVLRTPDPTRRAHLREALRTDLRTAARLLPR